jgi:transcriptional regulator with XRE-family HTH domain
MSTPIFKKNNAELLDKLKEGFGYKTDLEVAGFLGVTKETVSQIRRGLMELGAIQRFKIMDRLVSIEIRDLLAKIASENLANELIRLSHRGAENLAFRETLDYVPFNDETTEQSKDDKMVYDSMTHDIELIRLFKEHGCHGNAFATDKEMADVLGLKRTSISSIRSGKGRLGPLPRLRMLKAIHPEADTDQIERGIESSEYLLTLINKHIEMKHSKSTAVSNK